MQTDRVPIVPRLARAIGVDRARVYVIGEDNGGADEDPVLENGRLVKQRVVLDFAVATEGHPGADIGPATEARALADHGVLADMGEFPDDDAGFKARPIVHLSGGSDAGSGLWGHDRPLGVASLSSHRDGAAMAPTTSGSGIPRLLAYSHSPRRGSRPIG